MAGKKRSEELSLADQVAAMQTLQGERPNQSATSQWDELMTKPAMAALPPPAKDAAPAHEADAAEVVDIANLSNLRDAASREQLARPSIQFPKSAGNGAMGAGSGGGVSGATKMGGVRENKRKMTLDEAVADLVKQLSSQQASMAAAPVAVDPNQAQTQYPQLAAQPATSPQDPYAGLGDVNMPMGAVRRT